MTGTTLLDWIQSILRDPTERAAFQADPDDYADRHGFGDLAPADVHDALWLIADHQSASWEHGNGQVHFPPPTPIHQHTDAGGYLNSYITYNYTAIDTRDTDVDNSVHQDVRTDSDTDRDDRYYGHRDDHDHDHDGDHDRDGDDRDYDDRDYNDRDYGREHDDDGFFGHRDDHDRDDHDGGDFHQHIDSDTVLASGDGSTAIGGDNNADISSAGHDNTTAFGDGDAVNADFSDTDFGSGSAVNIGGGSAHGHSEVNTDTDVRDSFQDNDHYEDNDSLHVTDDSTDDHSTVHTDDDSHNDTHLDDIHHH